MTKTIPLYTGRVRKKPATCRSSLEAEHSPDGEVVGSCWHDRLVYRRQTKGTACQVVAAVNAMIALTGKDVYDSTFEALCRHCCADTGAALQVHTIYPALGLGYVDCSNPTNPDAVRFFLRRAHQVNLPVAVSIMRVGEGFHEVLLVPRQHDIAKHANFDVVNWAGRWSLTDDEINSNVILRWTRDVPDHLKRFRAFMRLDLPYHARIPL